MADDAPVNTQPLDSLGGSAFGQLVRDQLAEERARKASLEQRATTVVASSGTLATLLFGLVTFSRTKPESIQITNWERGLVLAAVGFFLVAAATALWVMWVKGYDEANVAALRKRVQPSEWYRQDAAECARVVAEFEVEVFADARSNNNGKAWGLRIGVIAEVIAAGCVGAAVVVILYGW